MNKHGKLIHKVGNTYFSVSTKQEENDYYYENGYMVFTESFLLKRGHCCKNSCRHCPYGFKNKK